MILLFALVLMICPSQSASPEEVSCSEPRISVFLKEIHDDVFGYLNTQHPFQPENIWREEIEDIVIMELKKHSPGMQFILSREKRPDDCEYYFEYALHLIGAGQIEKIGGLKTSAYTSYFMYAELGTNNQCGVQNRILESETTKDSPDIFEIIKQNISAFGNINDQIRDHEYSHPVPPRGPELVVVQEFEAVSPLENERKSEIKIQVFNCKKDRVYDENQGQLVILPRRTERGELSPTVNFRQDFFITEHVLSLLITEPQGASATYTLRDGIDPELDQIRILTCGLDKNAAMDAEIHISGLEIKVIPRQASLYAGEKTEIELEFNKVRKDGTREPLAGKTLEIEVQGLINGSLFPDAQIQTDDNGKAMLSYRAGDQDKRLNVSVFYKPKDYPQTVKGEAGIDIMVDSWKASITYTENLSETFDDPYSVILKSDRLYSMNIKAILNFKEIRSNSDIIYEAEDAKLSIKDHFQQYGIEGMQESWNANKEGNIHVILEFYPRFKEDPLFIHQWYNVKLEWKGDPIIYHYRAINPLLGVDCKGISEQTHGALYMLQDMTIERTTYKDKQRLLTGNYHWSDYATSVHWVPGPLLGCPDVFGLPIFPPKNIYHKHLEWTIEKLR